MSEKKGLKTPASHVARLLAVAAVRRLASRRATGSLSAGWVTRCVHTRAARLHHGGHFRSLSCSFSRPSFPRPSCPPATRGRPSAHRGACVSRLPPYRPWGCLGSLREVMSVRRIVLLGSVAVDMWGFSEPDKQGSPPARAPLLPPVPACLLVCEVLSVNRLGESFEHAPVQPLVRVAGALCCLCVVEADHHCVARPRLYRG